MVLGICNRRTVTEEADAYSRIGSRQCGLCKQLTFSGLNIFYLYLQNTGIQRGMLI